MNISGQAVRQSDAVLCVRFDNDIRYDAHSLSARIQRSDAGKRLHRRGRPALRVIAIHLKCHEALSPDLAYAWCSLLHRFEIDLDPKQTAPQQLSDTAGWIAWAERLA